MAILTMKNLAMACALTCLLASKVAAAEGDTMHEGFVDAAVAVPGAIIDARYAGHDNFVGAPVDGYLAPKVVVSKEVGAALAKVQAELATKGMALKLFDGYRPQQAVDHFMRWIADKDDTRMKEQYYPDVAKSDLVPLGYIAEKSGHSRGGSIDLTIVAKTDEGWAELDMGSPWDLFDERSHAASNLVSPQAQANRKILSDVMAKHGFRPYSEEWWHFTLDPEPFPAEYFNFQIK